MTEPPEPVIMVQKARAGRAVPARGLRAHQFALENDNIIDIPLRSLKPGRHQPRSQMSEQALEELALTIKSVGVIQPIVIKPISDNDTSYEIVAGERRWRACQLLKMATIPCIIRDSQDRENSFASLIENIQREDLHFIDLARAYQAIKEQEDFSDKELGDIIGRSRSAVISTLGVLQLEPDLVSIIVGSNSITLGHVKPIYGLSTDEQHTLIEKCQIKKWTVRAMEAAAKEIRNASDEVKEDPKDSVITEIENAFQQAGFTNSIKVSKKGSKYQILVDDKDTILKLLHLMKS